MGDKRSTTVSCLFAVCAYFSSGLLYAIPDIQTWQSSNGAKVFFVQTTDLPMVDVRMVFDAGSARDNGLSGLAALTNGLLAEGAGGKSAQQLAEDFESVGAELSYDSLRDMALVGVRSLTEAQYLKTALSSLVTVLTQPDFPEKSFQRELSRMKVALQSRKQSPSALAGEAFYKAIYGDHPYATPGGGTEESLEKITNEDVKNFYKKYYVASNAIVAIVGALDRKQAEALVNELVSGLPRGETAASLPEVASLEQEKIIRIPFPSKQSHIFVGQPGTKRGDKDYFTLYVANHPFGGSGFASRLVETVREQRGLAYSVYSYFSPMRELGPFAMGMQTRSDQTEEALSLLKSELKRYVEQGPDAKELKDSISNITGGFPLNLDSNRKLLGYIAMMGFYGLPDDYLQRFEENITGVTKEKINEALKRRIHPDKMVTVIVGNDGK